MIFSANYVPSGGIYYSRLLVDENGDSVLSAKEDDPETIKSDYFYVDNAYPNPFNSSTTIKYVLKKRTEINIILYDILGNKLKSILSKEQEQGSYSINIDMSSSSSGIYIVRFITPSASYSRKIVYQK